MLAPFFFSVAEMQVQSANVDLNLHTLGWKAFQDLCTQVCAEVWGTTVSIYREAQDGGQDAVLQMRKAGSGQNGFEATVQCKFSGKANLRLHATDVDAELATVRELVAAGRAKTYYFITSKALMPQSRRKSETSLLKQAFLSRTSSVVSG